MYHLLFTKSLTYISLFQPHKSPPKFSHHFLLSNSRKMIDFPKSRGLERTGIQAPGLSATHHSATIKTKQSKTKQKKQESDNNKL